MKYPEDFVNKVHCADCLEFMKAIPDNSIDLVLTDPPYNVGKDFGNESDKQNENDYLEFVKKVKIEVDRIAKLSLWFFSIKHLPQIFSIMGNNYLWTLCWVAKNKRSMSVLGYNLWQPILVFGNREWLKTKDYYEYTTGQENYNHPTPKPEKLLTALINDYSNGRDLVLDPFLGSGTTAVACKQLGRRFIGIEIEPKYCAIAEERLQQEYFSFDKKYKGGEK